MKGGNSMKNIAYVIRNLVNGGLAVLCFIAIMGFAVYGFLHFCFGM